MDAWIGGGMGYVLVSFRMCEFFMIPWPIWSICRREWKARKGAKAGSLPLGDFHYNGMASFHKDELTEIWRVNCNGQNGLPFLEAAANF